DGGADAASARAARGGRARLLRGPLAAGDRREDRRPPGDRKDSNAAGHDQARADSEGLRVVVTCEEFKEAAWALALDAVDPPERAACDAHLAEASHQGCREEYDAAVEVAYELANGVAPVRAPREVWDRVALEI